MYKRYFDVKSDDIRRNTYFFNGIYTSIVHNELLSEFFDKYDIPKPYQKVFFEKNILLGDCKEFFTDIPFSYKKYKDERIACFSNLKNTTNKLEHFMYIVHAKEVFCSKKNVMDFYNLLYEKGMLKNYLSALNEYFSLNLDLDYIFKLNETDMTLSMKQKLYKQREKNN